jgi:hypothetical protein
MSKADGSVCLPDPVQVIIGANHEGHDKPLKGTYATKPFEGEMLVTYYLDASSLSGAGAWK